MGSTRAEITPEKCAELYVDGGYSIRQIAAELNCSYGTVHDRLSAAGVRRRPQWATSPKIVSEENSEKE